MAAPIYIPINSPFSPHLANTLFVNNKFLIVTLQTGVRWYLIVVLTWISLMNSNVEHLFIPLCYLIYCWFLLVHFSLQLLYSSALVLLLYSNSLLNLSLWPFILFFFLIYSFIYLFWLCWVFISVRGLSPAAASGGHSSSRCAGLPLSRPLLLRSTGSRRAGSAAVAHGPSCSAACGILPDQGSNPRPLHWQADSQPLHHQGSPILFLNYFFY